MAIAALLWTGCATAGHREASARAPATVDVVLFPLSGALPIYVASDQGFYTRAGLNVRLKMTPDSSHLVQGLISGHYQLAAALIDNFVAYQEHQHAVPYEAGHDLRVLMGLSTVSAALVARADISGVAGLRGRTVGVDATGTGFAFMLYRMAEQAGLERQDFRLVASGSTKARWEALSNGDLDATLLTPEFATQAKERGFRILLDSRTLFPAYMGVAIAADRSWANHNRRTVQAFLRATLAARRWLERPENLPSAATSLSERLGGTPEQMARLLKTMLEESALIADGSIDANGLETVVDLRRRYAQSARAIGKPEKYLDLGYLTRARQELGAARRAD